METGCAGELNAAKLELWLGRSLRGMMLRDDLTALDQLFTRPEIDADQGVGHTYTSEMLIGFDRTLKAGK